MSNGWVVFGIVLCVILALANGYVILVGAASAINYIALVTDVAVALWLTLVLSKE